MANRDNHTPHRIALSAKEMKEICGPAWPENTVVPIEAAYQLQRTARRRLTENLKLKHVPATWTDYRNEWGKARTVHDDGSMTFLFWVDNAALKKQRANALHAESIKPR